MKFKPSGIQEINNIMQSAADAFDDFKKTSATDKAAFLEAIAAEIEALGDALILKASEETNLPAGRLMGERGRTINQLKAFAAMVREGNWVEASIDTALPDRQPLPKPDIRKMLVPLGPVVVFGASNFPFAFSTAGGDTASALAAGCPVIVKAHSGHPETSQMVYEAIKKAISRSNVPQAVFQHVHGSYDVGKALVQHPVTSAVGFTGSYTGGMALVKYASERKVPIPVFSEMGSVNPVVFFEEGLQKNNSFLAKTFAESITGSMGQLCTNPGLMMAVESDALNAFFKQLTTEVKNVKPAKMLNANIYKSYTERKQKAITQDGVEYVEAEVITSEMEALPAVAAVSGKSFLENHLLQEEVFGPYSILVKCKDKNELRAVLKSVTGQLTTSLIGTDNDFEANTDLIDISREIAGRIVFNGVPTGVEVCPSVVHGGPFPATTDNRYTAVGLNAVKRWVRPVCFQNCPEAFLPVELRNANVNGMWRLVNNQLSKDSI